MRRGRPLFYGWVVVGAAFVVLFVAYGAQYSFGVFFSALLAEFGWSRASLSGVFSLYALGYCLTGFFAGRLTDRWGPRVVIACGGVLLGGALTGMSLVHRIWHPYALYGVVAALGMGTAYVPCNTTVVRWFVRRRGLAVGVAGVGASLGSFGLPLAAQLLVASVGWRAAYVVFGLAVVVIVNAAAPLMRRDPESMGLDPDGIPRPPAPAGTTDGWSLAAALGTRTFWAVASTMTLHWIPIFIPFVHLVPLARDLGFSPLIASAAVSMTGAGAVAGRLVMGAASDRLGRKVAFAVALVLQAAAFLGLAWVESLVGLYAAAATFGFSYGGASTLFPAIVGDVFGRERAGAIVGFIFALGGAMGAWGPLIAGAIYDARGSYGLALVGSALMNVAALGALAFARPQPTLQR